MVPSGSRYAPPLLGCLTARPWRQRLEAGGWELGAGGWRLEEARM